MVQRSCAGNGSVVGTLRGSSSTLIAREAVEVVAGAGNKADYALHNQSDGFATACVAGVRSGLTHT